MLNPETITVLDPACGSGHILVEAYDVLKAIYLERGYRMRDIPRLILEKNLYGLDIDERAAQLAGFALLMKARADDRRLLDNPPKLNVLALQESKGLDVDELIQALAAFVGWADAGNPTLPQGSLGFANSAQPTHTVEAHNIRQLIDTFAHALTFGSLIQIPPDLNAQLAAMDAGLQLAIQSGDLLAQEAALNLLPLVRQARILGMRFDAVVANPPYMGGKYLTPLLKSYLIDNYKGFEKDLFSAFMIRDLSLTKESGQLGFMSPFVWMFISSYEELRQHFIDNATLTSLIQLEYSGFDGATVPICTFTLGKAHVAGFIGSYIRLSDFRGSDQQAPKTLEAIQNPNCGWFYTAKPDDFNKIPGSPVAYWASDQVLSVFGSHQKLSEFLDTREGLTSGNNEKFLRYWYEVDLGNICWNAKAGLNTSQVNERWFPCVKGGDFRRWGGNKEYVVNWYKDGVDLKAFKDEQTGRVRSHNYNGSYSFRDGLTWSSISSGTFSIRNVPKGFMFDTKGPMGFSKNGISRHAINAFLNSSVTSHLIKMLAPTLDFKIGHVLNLPFNEKAASTHSDLAKKCVAISEKDWIKSETYWELSRHQAIDIAKNITKLADAWKLADQYNYEQVMQLRGLEEENNRLFIEAYGLQNELSPRSARNANHPYPCRP